MEPLTKQNTSKQLDIEQPLKIDNKTGRGLCTSVPTANKLMKTQIIPRPNIYTFCILFLILMPGG